MQCDNSRHLPETEVTTYSVKAKKHTHLYKLAITCTIITNPILERRIVLSLQLFTEGKYAGLHSILLMWRIYFACQERDLLYPKIKTCALNNSDFCAFT